MQHERTTLFQVPDRPSLIVWFLGAVLTLLLGWTLRSMATVAVPFVFALLAVVLVAPLDQRLRRALPDALWWVAHLLSVFLLLGGVLIFVATIAYAAQQVLAAMPDLSGEVRDFWSAGDRGAEGGGASSEMMADLQRIWTQAGGNITSWAIENATAVARTTVSMTGAFVTSMLIILFITFMGLTELGAWRRKLDSNWSRSSQDAWIEGLRNISSRLRQFLLIRTLVGLLQGALYVVWLALFGVDLLVVWGVLTFLLTYIPTIGSVIAGTLPVLFALFTHDPLTVLAIAAGLLLIEQVIGNYVDPVLLGQRLVISPLVILIALMFWGWYWGIAGAFLATPIMLTLLIVLHRVPPLRPIALLLSNQTSVEDLDAALQDGSGRRNPA